MIGEFSVISAMTGALGNVAGIWYWILISRGTNPSNPSSDSVSCNYFNICAALGLWFDIQYLYHLFTFTEDRWLQSIQELPGHPLVLTGAAGSSIAFSAFFSWVTPRLALEELFPQTVHDALIWDIISGRSSASVQRVCGQLFPVAKDVSKEKTSKSPFLIERLLRSKWHVRDERVKIYFTIAHSHYLHKWAFSHRHVSWTLGSTPGDTSSVYYCSPYFKYPCVKERPFCPLSVSLLSRPISSISCPHYSPQSTLSHASITIQQYSQFSYHKSTPLILH